MSASEIVHLIHWGIYLGSILALILLFTRYVPVGAVWIAALFFSQAVFRGCLVIAWENYYRLKEGLEPIPSTMLTDRFSSNATLQVIISVVIALFAVMIVVVSKKYKKE